MSTSMSPMSKQMIRLIWLAVAVVAIAAVATGLLAFWLWRQVAVERFDPTGLVSPSVGIDPSWSDDGRSIVYRKMPAPEEEWNPPDELDVLEVWDLAENTCRSLTVERSEKVELFWPWFGDDPDKAYAIATWPWGGGVEKPLLANSRGQSGKAVWRIDLSSGEPGLVWKGFGKALFLRWDQTYRKAVAVMYEKPKRRPAGPPPVWFALIAEDGSILKETKPVPGAWTLTQCDLIDEDTLVFCVWDELEEAGSLVARSMHLAALGLEDGAGESLGPTVEGIIYSLRLSKDRASLAYVVGTPKAEECNLIVRYLEGGDEITVAKDASSLSDVGWSPDGKYIAYASEEDGKIHIVRSR